MLYRKRWRNNDSIRNYHVSVSYVLPDQLIIVPYSQSSGAETKHSCVIVRQRILSEFMCDPYLHKYGISSVRCSTRRRRARRARRIPSLSAVRLQVAAQHDRQFRIGNGQ